MWQNKLHILTFSTLFSSSIVFTVSVHISDLDRYYLAFEDKMNWHDARAVCRKNCMELVPLEDNVDVAVVEELLLEESGKYFLFSSIMF